LERDDMPFGRGFWIVLIAAVATMSLAGTALTNSISAPAKTSSASAAAAIGEFTFDQVAYNLNTTDPRRVDSITFRILNQGTVPGVIRARPVSTGSWYACSGVISAPHVLATCNTTSPQWTLVSGLTNMTSLTVVIRD
jgi:hypothetical protein